MLFETLLHPLMFLTIFAVCFVCSFVFDISALISFLCASNKIVKNVCNFFAATIFFAVFYLLCLKLNFGEIRFFMVLALLLATTCQRLTFGKIIAKTFNWCYNNFNKLKNKLGTKRKKHGRTEG